MTLIVIQMWCWLWVVCNVRSLWWPSAINAGSSSQVHGGSRGEFQ